MKLTQLWTVLLLSMPLSAAADMAQTTCAPWQQEIIEHPESYKKESFTTVNGIKFASDEYIKYKFNEHFKQVIKNSQNGQAPKWIIENIRKKQKDPNNNLDPISSMRAICDIFLMCVHAFQSSCQGSFDLIKEVSRCNNASEALGAFFLMYCQNVMTELHSFTSVGNDDKPVPIHVALNDQYINKRQQAYICSQSAYISDDETDPNYNKREEQWWLLENCSRTIFFASSNNYSSQDFVNDLQHYVTAFNLNALIYEIFTPISLDKYINPFCCNAFEYVQNSSSGGEYKFFSTKGNYFNITVESNSILEEDHCETQKSQRRYLWSAEDKAAFFDTSFPKTTRRAPRTFKSISQLPNNMEELTNWVKFASTDKEFQRQYQNMWFYKIAQDFNLPQESFEHNMNDILEALENPGAFLALFQPGAFAANRKKHYFMKAFVPLLTYFYNTNKNFRLPKTSLGDSASVFARMFNQCLQDLSHDLQDYQDSFYFDCWGWCTDLWEMMSLPSDREHHLVEIMHAASCYSEDTCHYHVHDFAKVFNLFRSNPQGAHILFDWELIVPMIATNCHGETMRNAWEDIISFVSNVGTWELDNSNLSNSLKKCINDYATLVKALLDGQRVTDVLNSSDEEHTKMLKRLIYWIALTKFHYLSPELFPEEVLQHSKDPDYQNKMISFVDNILIYIVSDPGLKKIWNAAPCMGQFDSRPVDVNTAPEHSIPRAIALHMAECWAKGNCVKSWRVEQHLPTHPPFNKIRS